ncbi:sulfatase-like hydrolase/transferase [Thermococcus barossii]|uniref:Sulfatase N-terminal domain-containing protein n=1 Tax=Thermococcus barossii TaxID=54077 RepID=A0A2Z2MGX0_9EURY|nr:sulfatase-like hydrolase/transferase [Thermococcus barossii]ASJ05727.1 hypothetical protein A3L01_10255 [Thermococcus barossii]
MEYPNVIVIVVDTLREDHSWMLEQVLQEFGFVKYKNVITPSPWTVPAHASMFTGLYPLYHGAHESKERKDIHVRLGVEDLLSVYLWDKGYDTYLFTANPYIRPSFGFGGFSHFYESLYIPKSPFMSGEELKRLQELKSGRGKLHLAGTLILQREYKLLAKATLNLMVEPIYIRLLARINNWPMDKGVNKLVKTFKTVISAKDNPKFIFINLMEVHEPYFMGDTLGREGFIRNILEGVIDQQALKKWKEMYPREVRYVSKKILEIIMILKEQNMFDNSLVIITSDHGQLLGEHGRIGHGTFLYDELLVVPLFIKYPTGLALEQCVCPSQYISLTRLRPLIQGIVDGTISTDEVLYSPVVFAESYGIHQNIGQRVAGKGEMIDNLEKYRVAIYYRGFKGIFNVSDWKFEGIFQKDKRIEDNGDVLSYMKKKVIRFLGLKLRSKI